LTKTCKFESLNYERLWQTAQ